MSLRGAQRRSNLTSRDEKDVVRGFSLVQWRDGTTLKGRTTFVSTVVTAERLPRSPFATVRALAHRNDTPSCRCEAYSPPVVARHGGAEAISEILRLAHITIENEGFIEVVPFSH
jgi:hypothetical protein